LQTLCCVYLMVYSMDHLIIAHCILVLQQNTGFGLVAAFSTNLNPQTIQKERSSPDLTTWAHLFFCRPGVLITVDCDIWLRGLSRWSCRGIGQIGVLDPIEMPRRLSFKYIKAPCSSPTLPYTNIVRHGQQTLISCGSRSIPRTAHRH
jgi:hypothetical protein